MIKSFFKQVICRSCLPLFRTVNYAVLQLIFSKSPRFAPIPLARNLARSGGAWYAAQAMCAKLPMSRPDCAPLLALLLTGLALFLRLYHLGGPSLAFYDELTTLIKSLEPTAAAVFRAALRQYPPYIDFQPPLYYLVVHAAIGLGHTDFLARMPAALAGAASVPLLYLFLRPLTGRAAALAASAALSVNLHHIEASQQVRLYAFLALLALAAMQALSQALRQGGARPWVVLAVTLSLGFWTSYLTAATLAGAGAVLVLYWLWPLEGGVRRVTALAGFGAALLAVAITFAPWLVASAALRGYLLAAGAPQTPPLLSTLATVFTEFSTAYAAFVGQPESPWLLAGPAALGLLLGLFGPRRRTVAWLAAWFSAAFAVVWLRANAVHHFQVRYLLPGLFPVLGLAGYAAAWLAGWPARLLPTSSRDLARLVLALLLGLTTAWPSLPVYPFFYRRDDSRLKTLAAFLRQQAGPATALALWGERGGWSPPYFEAFRNWYLADAFEPAEPEGDRHSRQCLVLVPDAAEQAPPSDAAVLLGSLARTRVYRLGLASDAPVLPQPDAGGRFAFAEDFSLPQAFRRVWRTDNVRFGPKGAYLADRSRPGTVDFTFVPGDGGTVGLESLAVDGGAAGYPGRPPSGAVRVLVGAGEDELTPYDPARPLTEADRLSCRLILDPGPDMEPVVVRRMSAQLTVSGPPVDAARLRQDRLAANTLVAPWFPGLAFPLRRPLAVIPAPGLAAFGQACPGATPVLDLGEGAHAFDPSLCPDYGRVGNGHAPVLANPGPDALTPSGLAVSGIINGPTLTLGATRFQAPLAGPACLRASLASGGRGQAVLAPLFTDAGFGPADAEPSGTDAVKLPDQPVLSCKDANPCQATYALVSGYPIRSLDLRWFPRLFADPAGKNRLTAAWSLDGKTFSPLDAFTGSGSGRWEGLAVMRRASVDLGGATGTLSIRFTLSGDGAQLWSSPETPLEMTLDLDTRSLPPLTLPPGQTPMGLSGPGGDDFRLDFLP